MDRDFLIDLFSQFGPVGIRRMFSGYGISADGVNFALVLRGAIYFKTDEQTVMQFRGAGSKPLQYGAQGKVRISESYWQLPDRLYDDPEELVQWARAALAAAQRAAAIKQVKAGRARNRNVQNKAPKSRSGL